MRAVTSQTTVWTESLNSTKAWTTTSSPGVQVETKANGSLLLTTDFVGSANPQVVTLQRSVSLYVGDNPVLQISVRVSGSAGYGIRFVALAPNGTYFPAWREDSPLQHRHGLGSTENITVNLAREVLAAQKGVPLNGTKIVALQFYLESPSFASGTTEMVVSRLSAVHYTETAVKGGEISGAINGLSLVFGPLPTNLSLFQIFVGFEIQGSSNLVYVPYFVSSGSVQAQGFSYVPKTVTDYEVVVLLPGLVKSSPSFYTGSNGSAILFAPTRGTISHFKLDSVLFRYTSLPLVNSGGLNLDSVRYYLISYLLLLFILPIGSVLLLDEVFRAEE
jgi:hypothetical protein